MWQYSDTGKAISIRKGLQALMLCAFVLISMLPKGFMLSAHAASSEEVIPFTLVICSGAGTKEITIYPDADDVQANQDQEPPAHPEDHQTQDSCPFIVLNKAFSISDVALIERPLYKSEVLVAFFAEDAPSFDFSNIAQSRAPPAFL